MPHDQWLFRIDDMITTIDDIESLVAGFDCEQFKAVRPCRQAVLWNFQVLGEAIKHSPEHVRDQHPEHHWELVRRTRNIIVHHYDKIDLNVIWETIQEDPPVVREQLNQMKRHEG